MRAADGDATKLFSFFQAVASLSKYGDEGFDYFFAVLLSSGDAHPIRRRRQGRHPELSENRKARR
jgi:hypothetical protein